MFCIPNLTPDLYLSLPPSLFPSLPVSLSLSLCPPISPGQDRSIRLWEVDTGRLRRALATRHGLGVCSVTFSPAGDAVASGGRDRLVQASPDLV